MKEFSLFVLLFFLSFPLLFAQGDCQRSSCKWEFFELEETVRGEVIYHEFLSQNYGHSPTRYNHLIRVVNKDYHINSFCPSQYCYSMVILKINQDTIRVLCSSEEWYDKGAQIYIIPDRTIQKAEKQDVNFIAHVLEKSTTKKKRGWRKEYKKAQAELPNRFDKVVLTTTFGSLSDKSDYERSILDCEKNLIKPITHNSFQCHWNFFEIEQPFQGKIIKYEAQMQPCHILGYASLAIVTLNNNQDTIRVLDYCNPSTFEEGEEVIIETGNYKSPLTVPYTKTVEEDQTIYRSNGFDTLVFKTTYGKIIHKQ